ncbi:hypothetical protein D6D01_01725 [Aureobasidium pullulans]|uniref:MARVEL domain-containing protein n=1 Tax=Aureobasidium pullulans TaxID=5580 RepID=A0A4V4JXW8_AURPU|nr:hypothetical protein D6D01_01725 [Aureobasidium pullulans]
MWIPQNAVHKLKIALHLIQAILTFITGCMTLAILTEKGNHDSRAQWCFALVFWISAFASTCAWTAKGMQQGAADKKLSASSASCSTFAFGSTSTCNLAKAATGLGVTLCILFLAAAVISGIDAFKFWKSGIVRTQPEIYGQTPSRASSPDGKDEWSISTDDLHGAKYASDTYQGWAQDHQPAFVESDTMEGRHPGRHVSCASAKTIPYERDLTPSAMSPTVTEDRYTGIFPPSMPNYSFSKE